MFSQSGFKLNLKLTFTYVIVTLQSRLSRTRFKNTAVKFYVLNFGGKYVRYYIEVVSFFYKILIEEVIINQVGFETYFYHEKR